MRILITNDDGINAHGLAVLERVAASLSDDVTIVAPETDQSGVAHSLSLNDPLRLREISPRHFAVRGTPTDCVIMAVRCLLAEQQPDLILSGVNRGQNVAEDVTYSGTIAAAMEGTLLGIPSFALSQSYGPSTGRKNPHWECSERHAASVIRKVLDAGVPRDVLININFPDCPPEEVMGWRSRGKASAIRPLWRCRSGKTAAAILITGSVLRVENIRRSTARISRLCGNVRFR